MWTSIRWGLLCLACLMAPAFSAEPKAKTTKLAAKAVYDTKPFDITADVLPRNYEGHDPRMLMAVSKSAPFKDEFETTEAFLPRVARWRASPLFGTVTPDDFIAIRVLGVSLDKRYDADSRKLMIDLSEDMREGNGEAFVPFGSRRKDLGVGSGKTMMGVAFKWKRWITAEAGTRLNGLSRARFDFLVDPEFAQSPWWDLYFIGRIEAPFYFSYATSHSPRIDEAYEYAASYSGFAMNTEQVWIVDRLTGKVMGKAALCPGQFIVTTCKIDPAAASRR